MKLVIIGNGFDLHHGLNTSFSQFRDYLIKNGETDTVNSVDKIITKQNGTADDLELCWNDVESYFFNDFKKKNGIRSDDSSKIPLLNQLEHTIEDFTIKLFNYLNEISGSFKCKKSIAISDEIKNANVILTFNYTSLYDVYTYDTDIDIFHIHGNLTDKRLPLIGFYSSNISAYRHSVDYKVVYDGHFLHKPALAMKQNNINFEGNVNNFIDKYKLGINEIVVIGFSFGESDEHIFSLLNSIMVQQESEENMPYENVEQIKKITFKLFSYNENETDEIISKIQQRLFSRHRRRSFVYKTGVGIRPEKENIISYEKLFYS